MFDGFPPPAADFQEQTDSLLALPEGATVVVLGGTDTGKTTWVREMTLALTGKGKTVAVLNCDLGQGEIGAPGTVAAALALPGGQWRSLRELLPIAAFFIGAISPSRHFLPVCVGAVQLARVARKRRPDLLLVDTDGFIAGPSAWQYKQQMTRLLLPHTVVALARGEELDPILQAFSRLETPHVRRIPVNVAAGRKTTVARSARRAARFLAALEGSQPLLFVLDEIALLGTSLGLGTPLPYHLQRFISESLRCPVLHAEQGSQGLYVIVHGAGWDPAGLTAIESFFAARFVTITSAQKFAQLLVGLVGPAGALLGIGRIERIDFERRTLLVQSPCRKPRAVAQIHFGTLRLKADGRVLEELNPGEV